MVLDFKALKKNSSNSLDKLTAQIEKISAKKQNSNDDENFWKPSIDKAGNGFAIIRFLPAPPNEDVPFVRMLKHAFKNENTNRWYIENSRKTIGQEDPLYDYNSKLWNSNNDDLRKQAQKQGRKTVFFANILVIKDSEKPECEGKVFKFAFGKKIMDKIMNAANPQFEGDPRFDAFNLWEGANFKLKIRKVEDYPNYELSEFASPSVISKPDGSEYTDEELDLLWHSEYSLQEYLDPKNFKSYDELKKRLDFVLGLNNSTHSEETEKKPAASLDMFDKPKQEFKPKQETRAPSLNSIDSSLTEDDDETMKFFQGLLDDDE